LTRGMGLDWGLGLGTGGWGTSNPIAAHEDLSSMKIENVPLWRH